jgi:hypothetical protein
LLSGFDLILFQKAHQPDERKMKGLRKAGRQGWNFPTHAPHKICHATMVAFSSVFKMEPLLLCTDWLLLKTRGKKLEAEMS